MTSGKKVTVLALQLWRKLDFSENPLWKTN